jgi:uncharacterized protein YciI
MAFLWSGRAGPDCRAAGGRLELAGQRRRAGFTPPYSPNRPSGTAPAHSGSARPSRISRWIEDYELSIEHRILAAGSLRGDDGLTPTGSLLLVGADSRDAAMALIRADPATAAGLRGSITIRYWNAAILDRREVG